MSTELKQKRKGKKDKGRMVVADFTDVEFPFVQIKYRLLLQSLGSQYPSTVNFRIHSYYRNFDIIYRELVRNGIVFKSVG